MNGQNSRTLPLAVVGMACRLPGADDLDQYWSLVCGGKSGITTLPPDRLNTELYFDPEKGKVTKTYCRLGGVVHHRPIDRDVLPIDDDLASKYDISYLTMCEVAAAAVRNAGYDPLNVPYRNTGVFIGNSSGGSELESHFAYGSYSRQLAERLLDAPGIERLTPESQWRVVEDIVASIRRDHQSRASCSVRNYTSNAAAALITTAFDLSGPSLVVNAECASAFAAMKLGSYALQQGQVDMAIVGTVAYRKLFEWIMIAQSQSMSARGTCPFDASADGLITSDGYGAILLKTLPLALADGDRICGVIRGIGMSTDGRGRGFWAPRKEGQLAAIHRAYDDGEDPARVQFIEAHATSTQLGDATEVAALTEFFGNRLEAPIPIGSVKANIGHTLETAGMASLIKVLLALQHATVPPATNIVTPNPAIEWDKAPFYLPTTSVDWPQPTDGQPRRAGINAFGIGGVNFHLIVDEGPTRDERHASHLASTMSDYGRDKSGKCEIAVVGRSAIFPGTRTVEGFWNLISSGRDPKSRVSEHGRSTELGANARETNAMQTPLGGFITDYEFDWRRFRVPPKQAARANPLQFMILDAVDQALREGGYSDREFDRRRVAVVVGTIFGGDFANQTKVGVRLADFCNRLERILRNNGLPEPHVLDISKACVQALIDDLPAIEDETASASSCTLASRVTKQLDLMGGAMAIDAGSASALAALSASLDMLRSGDCDMVLCAAGQLSTDLITYEELALRGTLAVDTPTAAFDDQASGFVPGAGVGVVLLKRLPDAERDGDPIHAVIRGVAAVSDAKSLEHAIGQAMQRGLKSTVTRPQEVGLLETAAAATRDQDVAEANALATVYGSLPSGVPRRLGSLVAQLGNTFGAAGMAALLKAQLSLENSSSPAVCGMASPIQAIKDHPSAFDPSMETSPLFATTDAHTCVAGVTAVSIEGYSRGGGTAYHLLLEGGKNLAMPIPPANTPQEPIQVPRMSTPGSNLSSASFIESVQTDASKQGFIVNVRLDPVNDPVLAGHRFKGRPLLPAAAILDLFAQAVAASLPDQHVNAFSAIKFHNGMRFFTDRVETARISVKLAGSNRVVCELRHDFHSRAGKLVDADRLYASGLVHIAEHPMTIEPLAMPKNAAGEWRRIEYSDEAMMWFGSKMRCLQRILFCSESGYGEVAPCPLLNQGESNARPRQISPPVFDGCLVGCATYTHKKLQGKLQMPSVIDRIELGARQLRSDETGLLSFHFQGLQENLVMFSWMLSGDDGTVLVATTGYRCSIVSGKPGELLLGVQLEC